MIGYVTLGTNDLKRAAAGAIARPSDSRRPSRWTVAAAAFGLVARPSGAAVCRPADCAAPTRRDAGLRLGR